MTSDPVTEEPSDPVTEPSDPVTEPETNGGGENGGASGLGGLTAR